jgi:hypothetical protein
MKEERPQRDEMGRFLKGSSQGRGGRPDKVYAAFKDMVRSTLNYMGQSQLNQWAKDNPGDFYKIAARLIPQSRELSGPDGQPIEYREVREYSSDELYAILEQES